MARQIYIPTPDTHDAHHETVGRRPRTLAAPRREAEAAAQAAALCAAASATSRSTHRSPNTGGMGAARASGG